jgi:hypothetical protein
MKIQIIKGAGSKKQGIGCDTLIDQPPMDKK